MITIEHYYTLCHTNRMAGDYRGLGWSLHDSSL